MSAYRLTIEDIRGAESDGLRWWWFWTFNGEVRSGVGSEEEAKTYLDLLNDKRRGWFWSYEPIEDEAILLSLANGDDSDGFEICDQIEVERTNNQANQG